MTFQFEHIVVVHQAESEKFNFELSFKVLKIKNRGT